MPVCTRAAPTTDQLLAKYGPDILLVRLDFPPEGHPNARPAASATLEAQAQKGDEAFWKMHDLLLTNPRALGREDLTGYGRQLSLDLKKLLADCIVASGKQSP